MHFAFRPTASRRAASLLVLAILLLPAPGRAQEVARRKWNEIGPYKNVCLRAADTLAALDKEDRTLRLVRTGSRKLITEGREGFEAMEWALADSNLIEPVSSLVWCRIQNDTVTMVVGHGSDPSAVGFTELRLPAAGLQSVYLEDQGKPPPPTFKQAARTGITVACILGGGAIGSALGAEVGVDQGTDRTLGDKEIQGYIIGGGLLGAAIGTFAAILLLQED